MEGQKKRKERKDRKTVDGVKKQKFTNCHLIWQLECRFNVWGQLHLSAKRHSFSSTIRLLLQIDVKVLLEQLIGLNVSMSLCTWNWVLCEVSKCFCSCMYKYSPGSCAVFTTRHSYILEPDKAKKKTNMFLVKCKHNMTVHFVYSYFLFGSFHPPKLLLMRVFLKFTYCH